MLTVRTSSLQVYRHIHGGTLVNYIVHRFVIHSYNLYNCILLQMLKAGSQAKVWPKAKSESEKTAVSGRTRPADTDDSDNEDKIPVPEFHSSFGNALEVAFETIQSRKGNC